MHNFTDYHLHAVAAYCHQRAEHVKLIIETEIILKCKVRPDYIKDNTARGIPIQLQATQDKRDTLNHIIDKCSRSKISAFNCKVYKRRHAEVD